MKERLQDVITSFFVSTALINAAMFVCGSLFRPEQSFGYEALLYPLLYGFMASIPGFLLYTRKELSVKQMIVREIVQVILIVAIIEVFMFAGQEMTRELVIAASAVAVSIVVVYAAVVLIMYWLDLRTARTMTDQLKRFQSRMTE